MNAGHFGEAVGQWVRDRGGDLAIVLGGVAAFLAIAVVVAAVLAAAATGDRNRKAEAAADERREYLEDRCLDVCAAHGGWGVYQDGRCGCVEIRP